MRAVAIAAAAFTSALVASCGSRHETSPPPPSHRAPPAPAAGVLPDDAEQKRFDAERRPDLVVAALKLSETARIADIGAGSGLLTVHLALAVPKGGVVATDIDDAVLELLGQRMTQAKVSNVERRVVPAEDPSLEVGTYDAIVLAEVDHYLGDAKAWLAKAKAALRPGGKLAITNRMHRKSASMSNAQLAGLVIAHESSPTNTHFLAVFTAR
jgi:cyclopropane fatty-acyl-phospholipid synthase-like methyltransferase